MPLGPLLLSFPCLSKVASCLLKVIVEMKRSLELCSLHRDEPKNAAQNADTALASSVVTRDVIALAGSGKQQVLRVSYLKLFLLSI